MYQTFLISIMKKSWESLKWNPTELDCENSPIVRRQKNEKRKGDCQNCPVDFYSWLPNWMLITHIPIRLFFYLNHKWYGLNLFLYIISLHLLYGENDDIALLLNLIDNLHELSSNELDQRP